jgi:phosphoribosylanthranilate isomerase
MSVAVKICGLMTPDAVDAAAAHGAAYAGFVFFAKSPRHVSLETARALRRRLPAEVKAVALTVDASDDELAAISEAVQPDFFQLHGREDPARVGQIRSRFGRPVIKAVAVGSAQDVAAARDYAGLADLLLFDAKPKVGDDRPGGNARAFEWALMRGHVPAKPWLLAGGLDAGNLSRAVQESGARAVDVSSGVERVLGEKDGLLIRAFLDVARNL